MQLLDILYSEELNGNRSPDEESIHTLPQSKFGKNDSNFERVKHDYVPSLRCVKTQTCCSVGVLIVLNMAMLGPVLNRVTNYSTFS